MSVKTILAIAGPKMGLSPSDSGQRDVLLRYLNEGAQELYDQSDIEGSLMEAVFPVDGNQQIVLPSYVGSLRAMREYSAQIAWNSRNMIPRYAQANWSQQWRNWRAKGTSATHSPITNEAAVVLSVHTVESPAVVVSISGPTEHASMVSEQVTLDATNKQATINFTDIKALVKDRVNNYDITVSDLDGNELAVIPNNQLKTQYRLYDVSMYPWSTPATDQSSNLMEVLYKNILQWLSNDDDEFPVVGMDNVIVNKMLQLWNEDQGKPELALSFDQKATRTLARKQEDTNRGQEHIVTFGEHPHDTLLRRNRDCPEAAPYGSLYQ